MPIQTRFIFAFLACLLAFGCSGEDSAKPDTDESAATTTAAADEASGSSEAAPSGAAATKAEGAEKEEPETPAVDATMVYADTADAASLSAAGQDTPLQVCWTEGKSSAGASYSLKGNIKLGPGPRPDIDQLVLVATDKPVSAWKNDSSVPIFSVTVSMLGEFKMSVEAAPTSISVCAFAPPTFNDNQSFMVVGCTATPIEGKAGATTTAEAIELVLTTRSNPLATIGGARFGKEAWTGDRKRRTVSGKVTGVEAEGYAVGTATTAILDEESSSEPLGMGIAGPDGVFSVSYFAAPREPLYVCGMAFDDAKAPNSLAAMACVNVPLPEGGGTEFKGVTIELSGEPEELDEDDKSHISLLQRCFASPK